MKKNGSKSKIKEYKRIASLIWTNKVNLGFLTSELKKRNWIKSQIEFARIFDNTNSNLQVHWNMQFKYELAYLLYRLKEGGFIYPVGSKGYFCIAERHMVDYSKKFFKENSLRKISSRILKNPDKYRFIIESVDEVIKAIL